MPPEFLKGIIKNIPGLKAMFGERDELRLVRDELTRERDRLREEVDIKSEVELLWVAPGHPFSPIPSTEEIKQREEEIFGDVPQDLPDIDLNVEIQLELLEKFRQYYEDLPFKAHKKEGLRYYFENISFGYGDAITLYCMLRHLRPKRIIEVGSGYSSCVILDTIDLFFDDAVDCTFIEPEPRLLESLLTESDKLRVEIIPQKLQYVDPAIFSDLAEGDILFIDSTHVSKIDSDVNFVFFKILTALRKGVYVHFHDIIYPFEYPKEWIYQGKIWSEAYLLRAFLQYNDSFKIQFFNSYLDQFHTEKLEAALPLCMKSPGGSIWIKKA